MLKFLFLPWFLAATITACSSAPPVQFYVLEPLAQNQPPLTHSTHAKTIGIGPITLSAMLDNKKIVTRLPGNAVQIAEFQQWASPLQDNILEVITRNLANLEPAYLHRSYPWTIYGNVDLQIVIDFSRFDATPGQSADLEAVWTIKNEKTHGILKTGRSVIHHPLSDSSYPSMVLALGKLLDSFSRELASAVLVVP